jgi:hypothetical protein
MLIEPRHGQSRHGGLEPFRRLAVTGPAHQPQLVDAAGTTGGSWSTPGSSRW